MIHHSNIKCDVCGERHSPEHTTECRDCLLGQRNALREEVAALKAKCEHLEVDLYDAREEFFEAQRAGWEKP